MKKNDVVRKASSRISFVIQSISPIGLLYRCCRATGIGLVALIIFVLFYAQIQQFSELLVQKTWDAVTFEWAPMGR